jgi:uncharacterized protein YutE (UPF0331/DUF86 family)
LQPKPRQDFDLDPYLRDIVERNLEIASQCCIDVCHRIIALENARKPVDYYEAFLILGEIGALPAALAQKLAPMAGFRNILAHEYLVVDWDRVYQILQNLGDMKSFRDVIRQWLLAMRGSA